MSMNRFYASDERVFSLYDESGFTKVLSKFCADIVYWPENEDTDCKFARIVYDLILDDELEQAENIIKENLNGRENNI